MVPRTVWFQTYAQALTYTKTLSTSRSDALLGLNATTPFGWLEDAWGLWGTGETLVNTTQRTLLVNHLLKDFPLLVYSNNTALLIARFFGQVIGIPTFEKALNHSGAYLSEAEQEILKLAQAYKEVLSRANLIEQGSALFSLPDYVFPKELSFGSFCSLPLCFHEALNQQGINPPMPLETIGKLDSSLDTGFIFSSGKTVQSRLLFEEIVSFLEKDENNTKPEQLTDRKVARVLLVHPNPQKIYQDLVEGFSKKEISVAALSPKKFIDTDFGKGFLALHQFLTNETSGTASLTDFLLSCISGIPTQRTHELNTLWRSNRLTTKEEQLSQVLAESSTLEYLLELFADADASIVLGFVEDILCENLKAKSAFLKEQLAALETLRGLYNLARTLKIGPQEFLPLLDNLTIVSRFSLTEKTPDVVLATLSQASTFNLGSFKEVIIASLDSESYQASEEHSATITLLEKLGITSQFSRLNVMRHQFGHLQKCAEKRFVCERPVLNQGNECYSAFMWDEYVNLYRTNENDRKDFDLPRALCHNITSEGEERLDANISLLSYDTKTLHHEEDSTKTVSVIPLERALIHTRVVDGKALPILSPSTLESYANCPYRWFYERKTGTGDLDEGFSALEKGTVAHQIFEDFYKTLKEKLGSTSLSFANASEAHEVLESCFNKVLKQQAALEPLSGRLVAVDSIEQSQIENLKTSLHLCLDNQLSLPENFTPKYFEFEISGYEKRNSDLSESTEKSSSKQGFETEMANKHAHSNKHTCIIYAGAVLNGRIDRIDFSQDDQYFTIIDYKGNIRGHNAGFVEEDPTQVSLPHKLQGLIYASAVKKLFPEKTPAAALYLSYNAKPNQEFLAGSYNPNTYCADTVIHAKNQVTINFQTYLDKIEEQLTPLVERLQAGNITPAPLCKESCDYCPVPSCKARWSSHD